MIKKKYFSIFLLFIFGLFLTSCSGLTEFKFDNNYLTLEVGETKKSTSISNETRELYFYSGDESIAQVDIDGNVTGITNGETIIYALFKNEPYKLFVNVISSTNNIEVYQREAILTSNMEKANIKAAIPIKATFNGHNNLVDLEDNMKIQFTSNLLDASDNESERPAGSKENQIKENIKFVSMALTLVDSFGEDDKIHQFASVLNEYNTALEGLEGEALASKIKELQPLTGYLYIRNDYLAVALFKGNELAAYQYSNEDNGIISKIKSIVLLFNQLISRGLNVQKVDYIELTKDFNGDLITEELANKLRKYQNLVSTLAYVILGELKVNKSKIDDDINKARITLDITEAGINKIKEADIKFVIVESLNAVIDLFRDTNTNYTHIRSVSLNIGTILGAINFNLNAKDMKLAEGENLYLYEAKHSEFENKLKAN